MRLKTLSWLGGCFKKGNEDDDDVNIQIQIVDSIEITNES